LAIFEGKMVMKNGQKPSNLEENAEGKFQKPSDLTENYNGKKLQKRSMLTIFASNFQISPKIISSYIFHRRCTQR
jgi:hypothetical protein